MLPMWLGLPAKETAARSPFGHNISSELREVAPLGLAEHSALLAPNDGQFKYSFAFEGDLMSGERARTASRRMKECGSARSGTSMGSSLDLWQTA